MKISASFLILFSGLAILSGCAERDFTTEDSGYSDLPHTIPADWEYSRSIIGP